MGRIPREEQMFLPAVAAMGHPIFCVQGKRRDFLAINSIDLKFAYRSG